MSGPLTDSQTQAVLGTVVLVAVIAAGPNHPLSRAQVRTVIHRAIGIIDAAEDTEVPAGLFDEVVAALLTAGQLEQRGEGEIARLLVGPRAYAGDVPRPRQAS